ncbi:hypothetical protein [Pseudomonas phoenicis]|uniref:hypothetical protein n=1 Tax=unclassified Pseudomonas TaxID=196821 RepID=UPI0039A31213
MSHYRFNPQNSFLAQLYWDSTGATRTSFTSSEVPRIGAVRDRTAPWASEGWLHADVDDFTDRRAPDYVISRRKFLTQFWFGCYETDGQHDYEIRAAGVDDGHHHWVYANHRLDVSRNGYLGVYPTADEPGHDVLIAGSMVWRLEGFPTDGIASDKAYGPVQLVSLHGKSIKRLEEDGFPYLNENDGEAGWLLLNILKVGVARP